MNNKVLFLFILNNIIMHSPLSETRLDDQETNELLCLPKPRNTQTFCYQEVYIL